ncbi:hypothetical protein LTS17_001496 [Exophiala oligosperma]
MPAKQPKITGTIGIYALVDLVFMPPLTILLDSNESQTQSSQTASVMNTDILFDPPPPSKLIELSLDTFAQANPMA